MCFKIKDIYGIIAGWARRMLPFSFNILLILLFFIIPFCWRIFKLQFNEAILLYTLWAILLYTWKTWQLKDLTAGQLSYATRPVVTLTIEENKDYDGSGVSTKMIKGEMWVEMKVVAKLKNVGEGVATNIEIKPIRVTKIENNTVYVTPGEIIALGRNDEACLKLFVCNLFDKDGLEWILIDAETIDNMITIEYNDLQGHKFYTFMKCKEKGGGWHFSETH